jgi:hypothetical protein
MIEKEGPMENIIVMENKCPIMKAAHLHVVIVVCDSDSRITAVTLQITQGSLVVTLNLAVFTP